MAGNVTCGACEMKLVHSVSLTEDQVVDFFIEHGVLKGETDCSRCGSKCSINRSTLTFRCQKATSVRRQTKKRCTFNKSARVGSFVERTHLPLVVYFRLVAFLLHLKPPRHELLKREFDVSDHFVVDWYSFCREVFIDHIKKHSVKLGGPGNVVEIDEAKFGRRKYNRGRLVEGQWVFGGIDRNTGSSFLVPVEKRDSATLLSIIKEWILPGTTIISDCWKAYDCLAEEGFEHLTVNHSLNFVDPLSGAHTNTIERQWREVRSSTPRFGVRKLHFVGYLAEYMFKKKYAHNARMHEFFSAAAELYKPVH